MGWCTDFFPALLYDLLLRACIPDTYYAKTFFTIHILRLVFTWSRGEQHCCLQGVIPGTGLRSPSCPHTRTAEKKDEKNCKDRKQKHHNRRKCAWRIHWFPVTPSKQTKGSTSSTRNDRNMLRVKTPIHTFRECFSISLWGGDCSWKIPINKQNGTILSAFHKVRVAQCWPRLLHKINTNKARGEASTLLLLVFLQILINLWIHLFLLNQWQ